MIYLVCGLIIGVVMGLTGAGGALIAIPLFMQYLDMPLKEASVYSLLAVVIASLSNFIAQRANTNFKVSILIVCISAIGSYLSAPYKLLIGDYVIKTLLITISLFATYGVWFKSKPVVKSSNGLKSYFLLSLPIGLSLGVLTTFTGLGGGVLMLPIFLKLYSFNQEEAVASSLLVVALSSFFSLLIQAKNGLKMNLDVNTIYLTIGILSAVFMLKIATSKFPLKAVLLIRKIVFTMVVCLAIMKLI